MYGSYLLCEWTQCCRAYLAFDPAAVCVDAEAAFLCVLSVVSRLRLLSGRVNVGGRASSPGRSKEAWDLFLSVEALGLPIHHVAVDLLPRAGVPDAGLVCTCRLRCACLKP